MNIYFTKSLALKNKVILFLFIQLFLNNYLYAQGYFEGRIIYKFEFFENVTGRNITDSLSPYLGSQQLYFINGNNYKSYNQDTILTQLYNSETNKYYFVTPGEQTVYMLDANEISSSLIEVKLLEDLDTILGYPCQALMIVTDQDTTISWFSPAFKVPFDNFSKHSYGHFYTYLKNTDGSLPLKYSIKNKFFTTIATALKVQKRMFTVTSFDIQAMILKE